MANNPLIVPLSRGLNKAQRDTVDVPPTAIACPGIESNTSLVSSHGDNLPECAVCREHASRYTCPRCDLPYCSVKCYQNHTTADSTSSSSTSACTEMFYQKKVHSFLQLEAKEHQDDTRTLLSRHHQQTQHQHPLINSELESLLPENQLFELLEALESSNEGVTEETLSRLVSPAMQASFERDLNAGKLSDLVLDQWHPWWRRDLGSADNREEGRKMKGKTLDERLLNIPEFRTLCKKGPAPNLFFNLMDLLYGICWTFRLYLGPKNASKSSIDAVGTLLGASLVLSEKTTSFSAMEEVLASCTARSTHSLPSGCNAEWRTLVEDVSLLLASHRMVGRVLLEVGDLIKSAIRDLKKSTIDKPVTSKQFATEGDGSPKRTLVHLKYIRKKIEFFLSWSQQYEGFGKHQQDLIVTWMEAWTTQEEQNLMKHEFSLPDTGNAPSNLSNAKEKPLLVEIHSTERTATT